MIYQQPQSRNRFNQKLVYELRQRYKHSPDATPRNPDFRPIPDGDLQWGTAWLAPPFASGFLASLGLDGYTSDTTKSTSAGTIRDMLVARLRGKIFDGAMVAMGPLSAGHWILVLPYFKRRLSEAELNEMYELQTRTETPVFTEGEDKRWNFYKENKKKKKSERKELTREQIRDHTELREKWLRRDAELNRLAYLSDVDVANLDEGFGYWTVYDPAGINNGHGSCLAIRSHDYVCDWVAANCLYGITAR